jgi:hypothetical protein
VVPASNPNTMLVWDLKARKVIQTLQGDPINLAARWMLEPGAKHGYAISTSATPSGCSG